jgi:hypothetical protein
MIDKMIIPAGINMRNILTKLPFDELPNFLLRSILKIIKMPNNDKIIRGIYSIKPRQFSPLQDSDQTIDHSNNKNKNTNSAFFIFLFSGFPRSQE